MMVKVMLMTIIIVVVVVVIIVDIQYFSKMFYCKNCRIAQLKDWIIENVDIFSIGCILPVVCTVSSFLCIVLNHHIDDSNVADR